MSSSLRSALHKGGVAVLGGTLLAAGLAVGGPASMAHAHEEADPVPSELAADWLAAEDGLLTGFGGFSWGVSIDAGVALSQVPGNEEAVDDITAALADNLESYIRYSYESFGVTYEGQSAGSTAKAAAYAATVGDDPSAFGGLDLVAELEGLATPSGRIQDVATVDGATDVNGDYANVIGQSFAARALTDAGSSEAGAVVDFLLAQQCAAGWFRQDFTRPENNDVTWDSPPATDGGCTVADEPNVDATALAVVQLQPLAAGDPDVATAVAEAAAWLVAQQAANGSLRLGDIPPNANSTGVAGAAFQLAGEHEAAEKAAGWLRALQIGGVRCDGEAKPEQGAVAYTPAELRAAITDGITDRAKLQRVATQVIPALLVAPESEENLSFDGPLFFNGGGKARIEVSGLALGEPGCVGIGRFTKRVVGDADGRVVTRVRVPNRTGIVPLVVDTADNSVGAEWVALAATDLGIDRRAVVAPRGEQRVVVTGLWSGERVVVRQDGDVVARGTATTRGRFVVELTAPRAKGRHSLAVVGQFRDRNGRASYRVR